jgi:copper chaperone NosL
MRALAAAALALFVSSCETGVARPAALDTRHDACAECRMAVSARRFAAQLLAPGEEPRFFDDLGCLAAYLRDDAGLPAKAIAYVADHRSGEWVPPASAVFTRVPGLETPMGSHVVAHASPASRDADPAAKGGSAVDAREFFTRTLPDGSR